MLYSIKQVRQKSSSPQHSLLRGKVSLRAQRDKQVDELFEQRQQDKIIGNKNDIDQEIKTSLLPVQIENIYVQKKMQRKWQQNIIGSRSQSVLLSKQLITSKTLISSPRGGHKTDWSPRSPQSSRFAMAKLNDDQNQKNQNFSDFARATAELIEVDETEEAVSINGLYEKEEQEELSIQENEDILNEKSRKVVTDKWAEIQVSLKQCDRNVQQDVSQTMKIINNNMKLIVNEQESKRSIRNLTSLESIFDQARKECIDVKLLDLTTGIEEIKDKNKTKKYSSSRLPTIEPSTIPNGVSLLPDSLLSNRSINKSKFTKLSADQILPGDLMNKDSKIEQNPPLVLPLIKRKDSINTNKLSLMYSRFVTTREKPTVLLQDTLKQKKDISRPKISLDARKQPKHIIPYLPLADPILDFSIQNYKKIDKSLDQSQVSSAKQMKDAIREQYYNNSSPDNSNVLEKTRVNSSINTTIIQHTGNDQSNLLSQVVSDPLTVRQSRKEGSLTDLARQSVKIGDNNRSGSKNTHSTPHLTKSQAAEKRRNDLPQYLQPFKELVLNTWRGKIGPTQQENVLFSNCLGMLSLHSNMTESVYDIKEYQFGKQQPYTAVPSQSTRSQHKVEKKFKKAAQNNPELKQSMINVNIQQLDQVVELEDPVDYLIQDYY